MRWRRRTASTVTVLRSLPPGIEMQRRGLRRGTTRPETVVVPRRCSRRSDTQARHTAVVLPAALIGDVAVRVFAGDQVVEIAPHIPMHGVYVPAPWILPTGGALLAEGIRRPAIEIRRRRIVVGVARQDLALAVHKQLVLAKGATRQRIRARPRARTRAIRMPSRQAIRGAAKPHRHGSRDSQLPRAFEAPTDASGRA